MAKTSKPNKAPVELAQKPIMPRNLKGTARKFWQLIVPMLDDMKYLQKIDRPALEMLCDTWSMYQDLQENITTDTMTSTTDKGNVIQHPLFTARNRVYRQLQTQMDQFGMTPAARVKLEKVPAGNDRQMDIPLGEVGHKPQAGVVPPHIQAQIDNGDQVATS